MFTKGQKLRVKESSQHFKGETGTFKFAGGPDADVCVIQTNPQGQPTEKIICVGFDEVEILKKGA